MRGDEAAKEKGMRILVGCIVLGILIATAPAIISWITGIDVSSPSTSPYLPTQLGEMLEKVFNAVKYGGALLAVIGLIYGGYQYSKRS